MAIYGSYLRGEEPVFEKVSFFDMLNFVTESDLEMNSIFERSLAIESFINEAEGVSEDITSKYGFDSEKTKKTILEKIKEIWDKFCNFVKTTFDELSKKLHDFYMNTNVSDAIMSAKSKNVTYVDLQKCREAGWKGIPNTLSSVCKICEIKDSSILTRDYYNNISEKDDIESIISAKDLDSAKEIYKKFKEKLAEFKSHKETSERMESSNKISIALGNKGSENYFFAISTDKIDDNHYFPTTQMYINHMNLATNGEKMIKEYRSVHKDYINKIKNNRDIDLFNMKNYKSIKSDDEFAKDTNQIMIMYYKAKYEFASAYIARCTNVLSATSGILARQHRLACSNAIMYIHAINKYISK